MPLNRLLALASVISSALTAGAYAQTQQQVAFLGDELTYQWGQSREFKAHTNWKSYGNNLGLYSGPEGVQDAESSLRTIINSGQKPIIHLMVGEGYADSVTGGAPSSGILAGWGHSFEQIIQMAQQARLPIVVGTIPYAVFGTPAYMNKWILLYCAAHGVPVVNYDYALNTGVPAINPEANYAVPTTSGYFPNPLLSDQGWALITDMAQTAIIQAEGYKVKSGYLQTIVNDNLEDQPPIVNGNTVLSSGNVYFTAMLQYTDGSTHIDNNADISGHIGTWLNSNQNFMYLDQFGVGTGLEPGTTSVHFITNAGVEIQSWTMYTQVDCNADTCATF